MLSHYSKEKAIYVVTQFNHPLEFTDEAKKATACLRQSNIPVLNQSVLLSGVNDNADTLVELFNSLIEIGISPYYLFQCRPIKGVEGYFTVPFIKGIKIAEEARARLSGISKRFRYALSHINGKMEILGLTSDKKLLLKQHQAKEDNIINNIFTYPITEKTYWIPDDVEYNIL